MKDQKRCDCQWCLKAYAPLPRICKCGGELYRVETIWKEYAQCLQCGKEYERYRYEDE